jgi:hypothetical protein
MILQYCVVEEPTKADLEAEVARRTCALQEMMNMVVEYMVVEEQSKTDLEAEVNRLVKLGWEPQGSATTTTITWYEHRDGTQMFSQLYLQALVRREAPL